MAPGTKRIGGFGDTLTGAFKRKWIRVPLLIAQCSVFIATSLPIGTTLHHSQFTVGDILVLPVLVWHMKMPVLAFRFGSFTYITDANRIEESEKEKIRGSSVIVLNALRKEKHISHYTLDEAIAEVQGLQVPQSYFTHISHQLGTHAAVSAGLPEGIELAWDGLEVFMQ